MVDVPEKCTLENDGNESDQQDGEQDGLIVQDSHGFWRGADLAEPVELSGSHGDDILGADADVCDVPDVDVFCRLSGKKWVSRRRRLEQVKRKDG